MTANYTALSAAQIQQFKIDGYLVLPGILNEQQIVQLRALTSEHLSARVEPFELETDVQYPGSPKSRSAAGGDTIRRLRMAYQRHPAFAEIASLPLIVNGVRQILGGQHLLLNPNHHNCVMTKQPEFSSMTLWHRDTRYWNFDNKYLINAWFALGDELEKNGAMKVLPGSHRWEIQEDALDEAQFLIPDHPYNHDRLATARLVTLQAGDALLFSAHCFHAAGRNTTGEPKYSLVFTYHNENTHPLPDTTSSEVDEIALS